MAKKRAAKKAAADKSADSSTASAADKSVADKVAAKTAKEGKAVYRLDQGESLPGPDPE